jgi:enoyl-CoA hydratase/carnithine racemase
VGHDPLRRDEARQLFEAVRAGADEHLGILDGAPVLLVDLDAGDAPLPAVPPLLPAVVVGIGQRPASPLDLVGLDVVLTEAAGPGSIDHLGLDEAARSVLEAAEASPVAAVVLAQVLRLGEDVGLDRALAFESLAYSTLQASEAFAAWLGTRPEPRDDDVEAGRALVQLHRSDDELTIVLDRPERRNALGARLRDALSRALLDAACDPSLVRLHLRGAGPSFCAGGDLNEFGSAPDGGLAHLVRTTRSVGLLVAAQAAQITCHLHGACVGAGIEVPAFADHVLAAPGASFRLPEVAMGLIPGAGGTASIPARIGRHRTAWLGISGATIDVGVALGWGLVDGLEPDEPTTS